MVRVLFRYLPDYYFINYISTVFALQDLWLVLKKWLYFVNQLYRQLFIVNRCLLVSKICFTILYYLCNKFLVSEHTGRLMKIFRIVCEGNLHLILRTNFPNQQSSSSKCILCDILFWLVTLWQYDTLYLYHYTDSQFLFLLLAACHSVSLWLGKRHQFSVYSTDFITLLTIINSIMRHGKPRTLHNKTLSHWYRSHSALDNTWIQPEH